MIYTVTQTVTFLLKTENSDKYKPITLPIKIQTESTLNLVACAMELSNLNGSLLVSYDHPDIDNIRKIYEMGSILDCVVVDTPTAITSRDSDSEWLIYELQKYFDSFTLPEEFVAVELSMQ